jgi:uncharacterized lipoprotein YmbA
MVKALSLILLLVLSACSGVPQGQYSSLPCASNQSSYDCQVLRYMNAP